MPAAASRRTQLSIETLIFPSLPCRLVALDSVCITASLIQIALGRSAYGRVSKRVPKGFRKRETDLKFFLNLLFCFCIRRALFLQAARVRTRFQDSRRIGETFRGPVYHTAARRTCG